MSSNWLVFFLCKYLLTDMTRIKLNCNNEKKMSVYISDDLFRCFAKLVSHQSFSIKLANKNHEKPRKEKQGQPEEMVCMKFSSIATLTSALN